MTDRPSYQDTSAAPGSWPTRRAAWIAAGLVTLAVLIAYHNSFQIPFIFDDLINVRYDARAVAAQSFDLAGVGGRPLAGFTFALNRVWHGDRVEGYHVFNLLVHLGAALVLLGIIRRTLRRPTLSAWFGPAALSLATAVAVIWAVHPLQTQSVVYISQRTESLAGLFYLLTLYAFIRGAESANPRGWWVLAAGAALFGALTKETIVTVPLLVLLYDRVFVSGSWPEVWRRHRAVHLGVALCWLAIGAQFAVIDRGNVGLNHGISAWEYTLTSCRSVMLYLRLSLWPDPLVFDYGIGIVRQAREVWPQIAGVAVLVGATLVALWRRPVPGFAGAWFLVILAPVSSIIPVVNSPTAEHRVYLSLAAVVTLVVLGLHALIGRRSLLVCAAIAVVCGGLTIRRNADYRTELTLWTDTVAKCPDNARAKCSLGTAYLHLGDVARALRHYDESIRLNPRDPEVHYNRGLAQHLLQRPEAAAASFGEAVRILPIYVQARLELGGVLLALGRWVEAESHLRTALAQRPDSAEAHHHLALVLAQQGRAAEAEACFKEALGHNPDLAVAHHNYGLLLVELGRREEARGQFAEAVRADPKLHVAHKMLKKLSDTTY